jgi:hypothetical protein
LVVFGSSPRRSGGSTRGEVAWPVKSRNAFMLNAKCAGVRSTQASAVGASGIA